MSRFAPRATSGTVCRLSRCAGARSNGPNARERRAASGASLRGDSDERELGARPSSSPRALRPPNAQDMRHRRPSPPTSAGGGPVRRVRTAGRLAHHLLGPVLERDIDEQPGTQQPRPLPVAVVAGARQLAPAAAARAFGAVRGTRFSADLREVAPPDRAAAGAPAADRAPGVVARRLRHPAHFAGTRSSLRVTPARYRDRARRSVVRGQPAARGLGQRVDASI
jgi:hypothetical protein